MFRHGVDLLALGLRFATSSLVARGDRRLPPYFNSDRDIPYEVIALLGSANVPIVTANKASAFEQANKFW
jgi:hypothetical protein